MRIYKLIFCVTLTTLASAASAGAPDRDERGDGNAYSASAFYRYEFGGPTIAHPHQVGLRLDATNDSWRHVPLLQTSFDGSGYAAIKLRGVALPAIPLARSVEEGAGFWSSLSVAQYAALGFTAIVVGATVSSAAKSNHTDVHVSGGG